MKFGYPEINVFKDVYEISRKIVIEKTIIPNKKSIKIENLEVVKFLFLQNFPHLIQQFFFFLEDYLSIFFNPDSAFLEFAICLNYYNKYLKIYLLIN